MGDSSNKRTRAFLFTDIEGSTRLWEQSPEGMVAALANHDELLTTSIEDAGGKVFKSVGDALCAVFPDVVSATLAAVDGQRRLAATDWQSLGLPMPLRVRMAVQSGQAEENGNDFTGPVLNRLARLLSAGHGGQILLTAADANALTGMLPTEISVHDLGERRLRDIPGRVRITQLVIEGMASDFPPIRTLEPVEHNIPLAGDAFVDRHDERDRLRQFLSGDSVRLVTILGPGGIGKTRLASEVARLHTDDFPDGVWFIDLAALREEDQISNSVMRAIGLKEETGSSDTERVLAWLRDRQVLLLLDNCEHVVDQAADFAAAVLRTSPHVRILATSRMPLQIRGEQRLPLEPLELPREEDLAHLDHIQESPSVQLFVTRAMSTQPGFSLDTANAPTIAGICRQMEGIPLALEIAAARITLLSPLELSARLAQRLQTLTSGSREAPERHQALRNAIAWSYELLSASEQQTFRQLSVFSGWTLPAMANVLGMSDQDALDTVEALIGQSLVRGSAGPEGTTRYAMLESIREYAAEQRIASGGDDLLDRAHAGYFLALAESAESSLAGDERQTLWMQWIDQDLENLRRAADWFIASGDAESALRLTTSIWNYWSVRGVPSEGRRWLQQALDMASSQHSGVRAGALRKLGNLSVDLGDTVTARSLYEQSLSIERETANAAGVAASLSNLGMVAGLQGRHADEQSLLIESLALWRSLGDPRGESVTLLNLGIHARDEGDAVLAAIHFDQARSIAAKMGDQLSVAWVDFYHARLDRDAGNLPAVRDQLARCFETFQRAGDAAGIGNVLVEQGRLALLEGEYERAERLIREGNAAHVQRGDKSATADSLEALALVLTARHDFAQAATALTDARTLRWSCGSPIPRAEISTMTTLETTLRETLGERAFEALLVSDHASRIAGLSSVH